jgi:hypothetical protein
LLLLRGVAVSVDKVVVDESVVGELEVEVDELVIDEVKVDELVIDEVKVDELVVAVITAVGDLEAIVVKGTKFPTREKVPFLVWQLHLSTGSLSQQNCPLPQLRTPASDKVL